MQHAVAYYRVSTARQGRSGLGIEAQRVAVHRFAQAEGFELTAEFVEVETGKGSDALDRRPQLAAALAAGRAGKCPVVVAKLDRLSRDVAFIAGLMAQRPELHYLFKNTTTIIEGDMNGDAVADFQIAAAGKINFAESDFVL